MRLIDADALIETCKREMERWREDAFSKPMSNTSPTSYLNYSIAKSLKEYIEQIPTVETGGVEQ